MASPALPDTFVHLHVHTEYSLLDGAVRINDLVARAAKLKMPAVAVTDHGNLYGCIDFYQAARKAGVKPIIGCELYVAPGAKEERREVPGRRNSSHLTVLAKNETGFRNLIRIVTRAHLEGQYYKPRTDRNDLEQFRDGLIVLSGCLNGEVNEFLRAGRTDQARETIAWYRERFGDDYYLELHDHGIEAQHRCNAQLLEFAGEFGIRPVAANDVHFLDRSDHMAHDVLICIGTGSMLHDEKRLHYPEEVYFKTPKEMSRLFRSCPQALRSTLEIAEKCNLEIRLDAAATDKYPQFDAPDGSPRGEYFRRLCREGLKDRYGDRADDPVLQERLEFEMNVMEQMGFLSYFLIVWDFIKWAKDNGIPVGPGRGSAAGSLVAYVLGITDLDPLRFSLIFERFLNPERISPPDIDVDFCQSRRGEVIDYVRRKYGERAVSHIITFGTLGAKSVIRDVGRVMGMSYGETDRIAKMIPQELDITLREARRKNPELKAAIENEEAVARLYETAESLEGLTRGAGIHAAGIVIGSCDLSEYVPLTRGNDNEVVTQLAMSPLTELGMLKMDFLGLKTLTVIETAANLIRRHTPEFSIKTIPLDDRKTFELLSRGSTVAVFQLESGGMANLCRNFGVESIEHIIALLALYRPGPMDLIPDFIARKKGQQKVDYLHPLLEEVSRETYGILIYQEQVMKAANLLAGYSLGAADMLRRAMGKKKPEEMAKQRATFVKGCAETNGIPEKKANEIFDLLEKFAGYGFNKSHSAAYGLVTYQTAWLKANHPVEFMCGVLSNEISNTEKLSVFVGECQAMGIPILPPDLNRSGLDFQPEEQPDGPTAIRYGLAGVKGVGEGAVAAIIRERTAGGEFRSIDDFARRVDSRHVNRRILENLIRSGAMDWTGEHRAAMFARIDAIVAAASQAQRDRLSGQISLFGDDFDTAPPAASGDSPAVEPWPPERILADEKELLGFYVSGHPLDPWRDVITGGSWRTLGQLDSIPEKDRRGKLKFAVYIADITVKYTRAGKQFAVMRVEDFTGSAEVIVWNEEYEKSGRNVERGSVAEITARIEKDSRTDAYQLIAQGIKPLPAPSANGRPRDADRQPAASAGPAQHSHSPGNGSERGPAREAADALVLHLNSRRDSASDLHRIADIVRRHPGPTPLVLNIDRPGHRSVRLTAAPAFSVTRDAGLLTELSRWLPAPADT